MELRLDGRRWLATMDDFGRLTMRDDDGTGADVLAWRDGWNINAFEPTCERCTGTRYDDGNFCVSKICEPGFEPVPTYFNNTVFPEGTIHNMPHKVGNLREDVACARCGEGYYSEDGLACAPHPHPPCLLYTSPSPRDKRQSRMPSSA